MKRIIFLTVFLIISFIPVVVAVDTGIGVGIGVGAEDFQPLIWMCDDRALIDDEIETGRVQGEDVHGQQCTAWNYSCNGSLSYPSERQCFTDAYCLTDPTNSSCCGVNSSLQGCYPKTCIAGADIIKGKELIERLFNYAFEGEKLEWTVLVMDKNKIEDITDVVGTIGATQGLGNDIEVECVRLTGVQNPGDPLIPSCNARILEEELDEFDDQTMAYYECTLTVETPDSMYGEYFITVEAFESSGNSTIMDENEYFNLNPTIALSIDDGGNGIGFGILGPGTIGYSETILVGNDADVGSGVLMDMFISGTDFYDSTSTGAKCSITNRLKLGNNYVSGSNDNSTGISLNKCEIDFGDTDDHLCYFATNGAYSTFSDARKDSEGYVPIVYGTTFDTNFYNDAEIIQANRPTGDAYWHANFLTPGSEMAVTFKLGLPEPCSGNFDDGSIYFWGEAI